MKIYLSACYRRQLEMQKVGQELETFGHEITSRWILEEPFPGEEHRQPVSTRAKRAQRNLVDLARSDCLIAFTERPPSGPGRGGRHVELGIALTKRSENDRGGRVLSKLGRSQASVSTATSQSVSICC
jgi:hypothetical protein